MERESYAGRLHGLFGISAMICDEETRTGTHRIIYTELCQRIIREESRAYHRDIIRRMQAKGADNIIPGGTEITMLISQDDVDLPVFDTTAIHAQARVSRMLNEKPADFAEPRSLPPLLHCCIRNPAVCFPEILVVLCLRDRRVPAMMHEIDYRSETRRRVCSICITCHRRLRVFTLRMSGKRKDSAVIGRDEEQSYRRRT